MTSERLRRITVEIPAALNRLRDMFIGGERISGALSPFDFPEKAAVGLADGRAYIEFVYSMVPQETMEVIPIESAGTDTRLHIGQVSGRIFRIDFKSGASGFPGRKEFASTPELIANLKRLEEVARTLPARSRPPRRIAHYAMFEELLPDMAHVFADQLAVLRSRQVAEE